MANLNVRRNEPREQGLARPRESFRGMDPFRAWDPFGMIRDIMGTDVFGGLVQPTAELFAPDIEVKETKDAYVLSADVPGVSEQDLEVNITGNRLTVGGKREMEEREENDRWFVYERAYGNFSRSFVLPEGADLEHIQAQLREGVLQIRVPKKAEVQPRRVQVAAEKQPAGEMKQGQQAAPAQAQGPKKAA